jgi:hypothetical protein
VFGRFAFYTVARDTGFVALAAVTLMVGFSFEPSLAFEIGASVALFFSLLLLVRIYFLTEERFLRSEAWRALRPDERPEDEQGQRLARAQLEELLLRFAKGASAIASIFYGAALVL